MEDLEIENKLKGFWEQLVFSYNGDKQIMNDCWDELASYYTNPQRYYHNFDHIDTIVKLIEEGKRHILNEQALFFAAFYHDIIYDITQTNNELRSALIAEKRLKELHVDAGVINLTAKIIRQTAGHQKSGLFDVDLFLDFDRCILSAQEEDYQDYAARIRKEYSIFSDKIYVAARIKMLSQYLDQPEIYYTPLMKGRENAARQNIKKELEVLMAQKTS